MARSSMYPTDAQPFDSLSTRRVLSRDDALTLGRKLLTLVKGRSICVRILHTARVVTKVTRGSVLNTEDGDQIWIGFKSIFGSGIPVSIGTDQLHPATLQRVVDRVLAMTPLNPSAMENEPDDLDDPQYYTYNKRDIVPVSLWHDTTIRAMEVARETIVPSLIAQLHTSKVSGSATVGLVARSVLYLYKQGLTAFAEETDCEVTVTARTPDGIASGWGGQAHRDWGQLMPDAVVTKAVEFANRGRDRIILEPGRRMTILGPAAVAQLVYCMAIGFDGTRTRMGTTPFSYRGQNTSSRTTKIGLRVFDPRIVMTSDPTDLLGGYPPFFEHGGIERKVHGFPTQAITWIDHGILKNLAYTVDAAVGLRVPPSDVPRSVRLAAASGTATATIEEMIANCEEGIYVNRFSDVALLDPKTGMMTGVTRDGCFLIKNGKLVKSVKNFRFTDSPFFAFNRLEMIGTPERVAFGYNAPPGAEETWFRWPRLPVIVPPMMVRDFNFSSLSDAV